MKDTALKDIGETFRRVRQLAGMTLDVVAKQADVTKGYLSKIESGRATPSIAVISKLADVYGLTLSDIFMPEGQRKPLSLIRANERTPVPRNGTELGYVYEFAPFAKIDSQSEVFFLTLPLIGHGVPPPQFRHSGEEIILVLEGRMEFEYGGMTFQMDPGDIIQFDPSIEHHGIAAGTEPAKVLVVTIHDRLDQTKTKRPASD